MGCSSCGGKKAQAASVNEPYEVTLPTGKKVTVNNKREERVAMDQAWTAMRQQAAQDGYRVKR